MGPSSLTILACLHCLPLPGLLALDNGFPKPPMGWNPWNCFGVGRTGKPKFKPTHIKGFNDSVVREVADAIVSTGLADAGYKYVNLDCGWTTGFRDEKTKLQIVNKKRFPDGMKALGDYIHAKGLKYGIYSSASTAQCCSRFYKGANDGSLDHEAIDAKMYVEWGVDYLKYDGCGEEQRSYPAMRDALNASGHPMVLTVNGFDMTKVKEAGNFANAWRTTKDDNYPFVESLLPRAFRNNMFAQVARPGQFNDADMLEVGNNDIEGDLTGARSHFTLWCAMKSPLLIGTDVMRIKKDALDILTNSEAIAINQDPLGLQAFVVWNSSGHLKPEKGFPAVPKQSVWAGPLDQGAFTAVLLNAATSSAQIKLTRDMLTKSIANAAPGTVSPPTAKLQMRDIWAKTDLGTLDTEYSATVKSHDVLFLKLSPIKGSPEVVV